ncbi:MAG: thioredoxin family protein [Deltaproteobacteria bacterium]|nr:MAG: thioredoxin family protein [Deltaproteobacteria bacterium]
MASDHTSADMVEGSEFPFLAVKYNVQGVSHTVINEEHSVIGAPSEMEFAREILKAIGR